MSFNINDNTYTGYIYKITNEVNDKIYIGQTTTTIAERWHGHMSSAINEHRNKSALYSAMKKYGRDKFHIEEISSYTENSKDSLINTLNLEEQKYIRQYKSLVSQNGYNFEKGGNNKRVPGRKVHKYDLELNYICSYESCQEAGRQNNIDGCTIYGCCKHDYFTAAGYVWCFDGEQPVRPHYKTPEEYNRKPIEKKPYVSIALPESVKRERKLKRVGWNGKRIFQYNSYGELINVFNDIIEASERLHIPISEIRLNLEGKNLCFGKSVLRNEDDSFDKYPRSQHLQPITLYDLQGNFLMNFETKKDAELFLNVHSGEITKVLKRGGSCKGYLVSKYGEPLQRKLYRCEKSILMYNETNFIVEEFPTVRSINEYFKIKDCHRSISKAIKNKTKYRGYYWKYKEEFAITA